MTKRDDIEWTGNIIRDHQEQCRHFSFALHEQSLSVLSKLRPVVGQTFNTR
jgi:hypothetical protein